MVSEAISSFHESNDFKWPWEWKRTELKPSYFLMAFCSSQLAFQIHISLVRMSLFPVLWSLQLDGNLLVAQSKLLVLPVMFCA